MVDLPLVTIVTPTYNNAEYLSETIESVLNQTYDNIEYIVINDGSTDRTQEILSKYRERCTVINQENVGQSETLNRGWSMANGSILGYISSDDHLKPDCISMAVHELTQNDSIVATYCDYDLIDSNGKHIRSVATEEFDAKRLSEDLICQPGPGAFFRAGTFNDVGGWRKELRQVPDFEFWLRLHQVGDFMRIPANLASFRIHKDSTSLRSVPALMSEEIIRVVLEHTAQPEVSVNKKHALSSACLISARSHFQSGRYIAGFKKLFMAIYYNPTKIFELQTYRCLISGIFRRWFYILKRLDI